MMLYLALFFSSILFPYSGYYFYQYETISEAQDYFSFQLEAMRQKQPAVFNLSSILIKPVQRIMKYPLLLNELVKVCLSTIFIELEKYSRAETLPLVMNKPWM